jgi:hypothetical protein
MPDLEWSIPAGYLKEGPVCAFPLAVPLNFTACCAANQEIQHNGCYQFCIANQTNPDAFDDFFTCTSFVATSQNQTLGMTGCSAKGSGTAQANRWKGSMVLVGLVMLYSVM